MGDGCMRGNSPFGRFADDASGVEAQARTCSRGVPRQELISLNGSREQGQRIVWVINVHVAAAAVRATVARELLGTAKPVVIGEFFSRADVALCKDHDVVLAAHGDYPAVAIGLAGVVEQVRYVPCACGVNALLLRELEDVSPGPHHAVIQLGLPEVGHTGVNELANILHHHVALAIRQLCKGSPAVDGRLASSYAPLHLMPKRAQALLCRKHLGVGGFQQGYLPVGSTGSDLQDVLAVAVRRGCRRLDAGPSAARDYKRQL
mmetsp:Transcript_6179/g.17254  ORF Transcript_6179/g.17254 Transcript_6179/m.17254 type:complete len:262 (+) Transcript_6179:396-1181(+)